MNGVCQKHPRYPVDWCLGCTAAVEYADNKRQEQRAAEAEEARTAASVKAAHRREAVANCGFCDDEGRWANGQVCNHDPATILAAGRGIEKVRAALREARNK